MLVSTHTIVNESASAAVDQPYSFGHGFGPGAVPAGWRLVGEMPDGTPVISGTRVQVRIEGGSDGALHKITCRVTDTVGNVVEQEGLLKIDDI